ncbi:MAG: NYN domain-containing protein [Patescibacteria group bacterium]|nr:NYN domain-containing protein [Patescibacteria group bacterium]
MKAKRIRSIIIIDGSNLYYKLKSFGIRETFDFSYNKWIQTLLDGSKLIGKYYCIGKIKADQKNKKAVKMMAKQQSLVTRLIKDGFIIQYGYLLKSGGRYHEKGVDVQMAVDMMKSIYKKKCERVILISSDSDLIPAITEIQNEDGEVVYVGFKNQESRALLKSCKRSILLEKKNVEGFAK